MSRRGDREFLLDILEACNRIIGFTKDMSYDEFAGMRDKLIHFYFGVNLDIVWDVARNKVPVLKDKISKLLSGLE